MFKRILKFVLLGLFGLYCVCGALAVEPPQNPSDTRPNHRCTDLQGEPVPCPGEIQPSPASGSSATVSESSDRCKDVSGEPIACHSTVRANPPSTKIATQSRQATQNAEQKGKAQSVSLKPTPPATPVNTSPKTEVKAVDVAASAVEPDSEEVEGNCRDVSGQPVSCPIAIAVQPTVKTSSSSSNPGAVNTAAMLPGSTAYVSSTTHQKSLERSLPKDIYEGQRDFWSMPAHFRTKDLYWGVPFGLTTAALIAGDTSIQKELPTNPNTIKRFDNLSNYGAAAFAGLVGTTYLWGKGTHNSYLSNTAWLAGESGLNGFITTYALKSMLGRQRPDEGNGQGDFFSGGQSFPSEHAAAAWSVATVFADRYPSNWTKFFLYGGASTISVSRMLAQKHFSSDVFIGSAIGWYFGHQAVQRYNREHSADSIYGKFLPSAETRTVYPRSSNYIELDSWIYPVVEQLAAKGIARGAYFGLRPWTRESVYNMLEGVNADALKPGDAQLVMAIRHELRDDAEADTERPIKSVSVDRIYERTQYVSGNPLNDSYHFGQTIVNDYGRPYGKGWQQIAGVESHAELGPLTFHFRGEYQHSPGTPAYTDLIEQVIAKQDSNPIQQVGAKPAQNSFRLLDTYVSVHLFGNEISFGKQSYWWGPGDASALFLSKNVEPFYSVRIALDNPVRIPLLSRLMGPMRYDNFFGKLSGHQFPRQPYFYGQKISFFPTRNLEVGFSRDAVIAGDGVAPMTFDTFFRSFFSTSSGTCPTCDPSKSPGARHGNFDFRYRIPGLRNWLTLYTDSLVHDDPSPLDAPRRAAITSGIYLTKFPGLNKLDLHVEGGTTDTVTSRAKGGQFYYYQSVYRDAYLNKGKLMGSWLGREGTGGNAWVTYRFDAQSTLQIGYRYLKTSQYFVPEGETQHDGYGQLDYSFHNGLGIKFFLQAERWASPVLAATPQTDVTTQFEISFSPRSWNKSSQGQAHQ